MGEKRHICKLLNQCLSKPVVITDTMNLWIDIAKESLLKVLKKTDILLINESEVYDLTGIKDISESTTKLHWLGPKKIIVKSGSKGSTMYITDGDSLSVNVIPVKDVIDPTGAGDSYGGGLVSALAQGLSIKDAMIRGTVMASLCIESFGVKSILNSSLEKINSRIKTLSN